MKKIFAVLLLVSYIAFVPVCFLGTQESKTHMHRGTTPVTHAEHGDTTPLMVHTEMYTAVSSAHFTAPLTLPLLRVVVLAVAVAVAFGAALFLPHIARVAFLTHADEHRHRQSMLMQKMTFLRFLAQLIASPNLRYALA